MNGARKVIVYLSETCYLPTKEMFGQYNFDLVEIRRLGTVPFEGEKFTNDFENNFKLKFRLSRFEIEDNA